MHANTRLCQTAAAVADGGGLNRESSSFHFSFSLFASFRVSPSLIRNVTGPHGSISRIGFTDLGDNLQ